jgi:flagellar hook assembly protein FlgD
VHLVRTQRGGATILNNVINPDKGDLTTLQYILGLPGQVTVTVFDLSGSIVNVLARANLAAGEYSVTWDGKNRGGRAVARGIYFVRVVGPGIDETRKVLVVR